METKIYVKICNGLSEVCKLMSEEKENIKQKKKLLKYADEFKVFGQIYANLHRRKDVKEKK